MWGATAFIYISPWELSKWAKKNKFLVLASELSKFLVNMIVPEVHQNEGNAFKNRQTLVTLASILKQSCTSFLEYEGREGDISCICVEMRRA